MVSDSRGWPATQVALAQKARDTELYLSRFLRLEAEVLMKASERIHPDEGALASAAAVGLAAEVG